VQNQPPSVRGQTTPFPDHLLGVSRQQKYTSELLMHWLVRIRRYKYQRRARRDVGNHRREWSGPTADNDEESSARRRHRRLINASNTITTSGCRACYWRVCTILRRD